MNEIKLILTNLSVQDVNAILAGLQELPAKISNPLTQRIQQEAQKQLQEYQQPVEQTKAE